MPNQYIPPPQQDRQQAEGVREKAEDSRQDAEQDRGFTEGDRTSEESARTEAEQFRRLAEEAWEVRDQHRAARRHVTGFYLASRAILIGAQLDATIERASTEPQPLEASQHAGKMARRYANVPLDCGQRCRSGAAAVREHGDELILSPSLVPDDERRCAGRGEQERGESDACDKTQSFARHFIFLYGSLGAR